MTLKIAETERSLLVDSLRTIRPRNVEDIPGIARVHSEYNIQAPTLPPPNPQGKMRLFTVILNAHLGEAPAGRGGQIQFLAPPPSPAAIIG